MRITKRAVDALEAPAGKNQAFLWDDKLPGFGVRVTRTGVKSFIFQKRIKGRDKRITIGRYGALTAEQARRQAQHLAGDIATGGDPVEQRRRDELEQITLRQAFERMMAAKEYKPTTRYDMQRAMKGFSDWMDNPLKAITSDMIRKRYAKLCERSKTRASGAMRYLRGVFNFAMSEYTTPEGEPILTYNPVQTLSKTKTWYRPQRRQTVIKAHQLKPWCQAVAALAEVPEREPGTGRQHPKHRRGEMIRDYFMLVLLTGLRRNEALGLKWENVDLAERTLTLDDTKAHRSHTLPLSDYLQALLERRQAASTSEYVFADDVGRLQNLRYSMERVQSESGVQFCIHDLRRTFATVAESLDISYHSVKRLLNHSTNGDVTAEYIVGGVERLRQPMQRITDHILQAGGLR